MMRILVVFGLCLAGCNPCAPEKLSPGQIQAEIDAVAWAGEGATWRMAGSSLQMNSPESDGWALTLVAIRDVEGTSVEEALAAANFPIEVPLSSGESGFATLYPSEGSSLVTEETSGTLEIHGVDGDALYACFEFSAASDDRAVVIADGSVHAELLEFDND